MRDYFVIAAVLASLPVGLFRPFYGLLVYAWISYMYPHELAWSFAQTFPVAKLSALSVVGGLMLAPSRSLAAVRPRESIWMGLLGCMFTIARMSALHATK